MTEAHEWIVIGYDADMKPIIFIVPIGAGKSTISEMVGKELSLPVFSLDAEEHLAASTGYDVELYARMQDEKGLPEAYEYRRGFYDRLVPLFLESHSEGVLDLGGGHPIVPDPERQKAIKDALAPYENIILLMPTPDPAESLKILKQRNQIKEGDTDLNELYFKDGNKTFWEIAKFPVYTEGKTPEQTRDEIIELLNGAN